MAALQQVTTFPTRPTSDLRAHPLALTTPSVDILGPAVREGNILCRVSVFMFNSVESCFNNDFIWFTLSTADRQIGDSPKLLKIQEKYRRQ